jgi:tetratricopeptide (TPR) repeat protein
MRRVARRVIFSWIVRAVALALLLGWLIVRGTNAGGDGADGTTPTTTTELRPLDAAARGAEQLAEDLDAPEGLTLTAADFAVLFAVLVLLLALIWRNRRASGLGPVSVHVVDASGGTADNPSPPADAINALVRDRLARVDLRPPVSVPSTGEDVGGLIDVLDTSETKAAQATFRLFDRIRNSRPPGYEVQLVLRRSDTTKQAGITVDLIDRRRGETLSVKTIWADSFHAAARGAAFQAAAVLLRKLPTRDRGDRWVLWEESGASLRSLEDGLWETRARHYDQAAAIFEAGLSQDPENHALRLRLGHALERLGDYQRAALVYAPAASGKSREGSLARWRMVTLLANAQIWAGGWVKTAVAESSTGITTDSPARRLRALVEQRYGGTKVAEEFPTLFQTLFAERSAREPAFGVGATAAGLPHVEVRAKGRGDGTLRTSIRLTADQGAEVTVPALLCAAKDMADLLAGLEQPRAVPAPLPVEARRDEQVVKLDAHLTTLLADARSHLELMPAGHDKDELGAATERLEQARVAVSTEHLLWRASAWEASRLDRASRRASKVAPTSLKLVRTSLDDRRIASVPSFAHRSDIANVRLDLENKMVRLGTSQAGRWNPFARPRWNETKAQVAYNAACGLALRVLPPPPPEADIKLVQRWTRDVDPLVEVVIGLLEKATRGPSGMIAEGAVDWLVHEDPDLDAIRLHRRFQRFSLDVLAQQKEPARVERASLSATYSKVLAREAAKVAIQRLQVTPPSMRTAELLEVYEKELAMWEALGKLCSSETDSRARHDVWAKAAAFAVAPKPPPRWPDTHSRPAKWSDVGAHANGAVTAVGEQVRSVREALDAGHEWQVATTVRGNIARWREIETLTSDR